MELHPIWSHWCNPHAYKHGDTGLNHMERQSEKVYMCYPSWIQSPPPDFDSTNQFTKVKFPVKGSTNLPVKAVVLCFVVLWLCQVWENNHDDSLSICWIGLGHFTESLHKLVETGGITFERHGCLEGLMKDQIESHDRKCWIQCLLELDGSDTSTDSFCYILAVSLTSPPNTKLK